MLLMSGAASAEQVFSFDTTPGKLPKNVVPVRCAVEVKPEMASLADIALDATAETATFTFAQPIAAGSHRLRIGFTSRINKFDRGFNQKLGLPNRQRLAFI